MKRLAWAPGLLLLGACVEPSLDSEALLDPQNCAECHPVQYEQWSGSMHAYAAEDPVFLAMNARGQEETGGALGDFCIGCHAPLAVRLGYTDDGLNLDEVPDHLLGVTCAFCHLADEVTDTHNAPIVLAEDGVLRGGLADPVANPAHPSAYSTLHDRNQARSSELCGSCHDIVTPAGLHLERTYAEWQESIFSDEGASLLTCGGCHMRGSPGRAANGGPERRVHEHSWPGVDLAITDFPNRDTQRALVQDELDLTLQARLCVGPIAGGVEVTVVLENVGAGHMMPSGASQDRRLWTEVIAYEGDEAVFSTGVVADGEPVAPTADGNLWLFRDRLLNDAGEEVHMFWEATQVEANLLPTSTTLDPADPAYYHSVERSWPILGSVPDRVTLRARMRPIGLEVLDDLVASGHLAPEHREAMQITFDLAPTVLEWTGPVGSCVGDL